MRDIFRKVPLSEKKALFKKGSAEKMAFYGKGEGADDIIRLVLDEYVDDRVLTFNYAINSPQLLSDQDIILNFAEGEDRFFLQANAEVYDGRVHISARTDVYVLQRRKTPRLDMPKAYPGHLNIIAYQKKAVLFQCRFLDFSSGGCRVQYAGHLPLFKAGDIFRGVIHLNHRNPVELDCVIRHHVLDTAAGTQTFGVQFNLSTTILENKMLVVFMDLQRELFTKWNSGR